MGNWENDGESSEWYTPKYIFDALQCRFDMDVAAAPDGFGHVPASRFCRDAFNEKWFGFVWCNPPFSKRGTKQKWVYMNKIHGDGILLFPDRSSTDWWQEAAKASTSLLMIFGKIKFIPGVGNNQNWKQPGCGTTLFAFGNNAHNALVRASNNGLGIHLKINK